MNKKRRQLLNGVSINTDSTSEARRLLAVRSMEKTDRYQGATITEHTEYKILTARNTAHMTDQVKTFTELGWSILGGVQVVFRPREETVVFYQTITRHIGGF